MIGLLFPKNAEIRTHPFTIFNTISGVNTAATKVVILSSTDSLPLSLTLKSDGSVCLTFDLYIPQFPFPQIPDHTAVVVQRRETAKKTQNTLHYKIGNVLYFSSSVGTHLPMFEKHFS